jgi:NADH-quinone oxidoreductase subunit F
MGLEKAVTQMTPDSIIETITESGLRGRGGAGFSTGTKWKFAKASVSEDNIKYVVCNGDEGDPGAFMDRSVLEGDPHSVIEGMAVCARAIGASKGFIYVRAEYPLAVKNLNIAIKAAREKGWIGSVTKWPDFQFDLSVREGAGAFVCGEETALLASVEGKRGMPRLRPPFPAVKGLYKKPTNINNVETYANIPWIITRGSNAFSEMGMNRSRGTKVFALAGKIKKGGLIEVPMGISIREIIFDIGGGTLGDLPFKAVQLGGPSGGCIPESLIDTPVDYEELAKTGAIVGSGGMIVMDESSCMVDIARFFLSFTQEESCGKCTFCRIGTKRMLEILTNICEGKGQEGDIELLQDLAVRIKDSSLCGLGQTAPNPVLTTIKYFRHEYEAHIRDKKCPAKACKALISFYVNENCIGCGACKRVCPVDAVIGSKKEIHIIDQEKCIKCGACYSACKFKAIDKK